MVATLAMDIGIRLARRLLVAAAILTIAPISAQEAPSPGQVDTGQREAAQRAEGLLDGSKPFRLLADEDGGEILWDVDFETNEVRRVTARKNVIFVGDGLSLNCDALEYDAVVGELVATGRRVVVRQGEVTITCQLFRYNPATQESELIGNAVIYSKGRDGKPFYVTGDQIVVFKENGRTRIKVTGSEGRAPILSNSQQGALEANLEARRAPAAR